MGDGWEERGAATADNALVGCEDFRRGLVELRRGLVALCLAWHTCDGVLCAQLRCGHMGLGGGRDGRRAREGPTCGV